MRAILVGQAPSRTSAEPLDGRCGRRLESLAGIGQGTLLEFFDAANLLPAYPGKAGKGDLFPASAARANAEGVHRVVGEERYERVVLLGWNVASAMGLAGAPAAEWLEPGAGRGRREDWYAAGRWRVPGWAEPLVWAGSLWAVFPHPSGVSRWWNDGENVDEARAFLRELVQATVARRRHAR